MAQRQNCRTSAWPRFHDDANADTAVTLATIDDLFAEKVRSGMFRPILRHVAGYADPEDRLQDAIAQTWLLYRRTAVDQGYVLPDAVLMTACTRYARDLSRRFVPGDYARRSEDILDPRAARRGVTVTQLDDAPSVDEYDVRIAWSEFYDTLNEMQQRVLDGLADGKTTREIGDDLGRSSSSVTRQSAFIRGKAAEYLRMAR